MEIWGSNRKSRVFSFQDPATRDMLDRLKRESDERAAAEQEAFRQAQLANARAEVARLEDAVDSDPAKYAKDKEKADAAAAKAEEKRLAEVEKEEKAKQDEAEAKAKKEADDVKAAEAATAKAEEAAKAEAEKKAKKEADDVKAATVAEEAAAAGKTGWAAEAMAAKKHK